MDCEYCGVEFEARRDAKFCSTRCRMSKHRKGAEAVAPAEESATRQVESGLTRWNAALEEMGIVPGLTLLMDGEPVELIDVYTDLASKVHGQRMMHAPGAPTGCIEVVWNIHLSTDDGRSAVFTSIDELRNQEWPGFKKPDDDSTSKTARRADA